MAVSVALVAAGGVFPIGNALLRPLENRFPPWDASSGSPNGIIVLGGVIDPWRSEFRGEPVIAGAADRIAAAVALARHYPAARIVYSGGSGTLDAVKLKPEAELASQLLVALGIVPDHITVETRARNTAENAAYTKDLLKPAAQERWLLVTSAYHMPRAIGAFRRVGFPVEAFPADWQTGGRVFTWSADLAKNWEMTNLAVKEWIGLVLYWLSDRSSALFPQPDRQPSRSAIHRES